MFFGDYDVGAIWSLNMTGGDQWQHTKFTYPAYISEVTGYGLLYADGGWGG